MAMSKMLLYEFLEKLATENGCTVHKLCVKISVSPNTFREFMPKRGRTPTLRTVYHVADALGIDRQRLADHVHYLPSASGKALFTPSSFEYTTEDRIDARINMRRSDRLDYSDCPFVEIMTEEILSRDAAEYFVAMAAATISAQGSIGMETN